MPLECFGFLPIGGVVFSAPSAGVCEGWERIPQREQEWKVQERKDRKMRGRTQMKRTTGGYPGGRSAGKSGQGRLNPI